MLIFDCFTLLLRLYSRKVAINALLLTTMPQEFHLSAESAKLKSDIVNRLQERDTGDKKYVVVQFYINRIFKIDDVNESLALDFYLKLNWVSENWKGKTDDEFQEDENRFDSKLWWEPGVEVTNAIELEKMIEKDEAFWLEYPDEGILAYTQRFIGTISAPMDLHNFPFDQQKFRIQFESFHWKADDCELLMLPRQSFQTQPNKDAGESWLTMSNDVRLSEWMIDAIEVAEKMVHYAFEDRIYSQVVVSVSISRNYGYYISKLMSVLLLIVIMCWIVFLIPAEYLSDRMSIVVTLFLSAVAFNFVGSSSIPKVSYLTQFDKYMIACYVMIVATVIENLVSYLYYTYAGSESWVRWANPVDLLSVIVFPIITVALHLLYLGQVFHSTKKIPKLGKNGFQIVPVSVKATSEA